MSAAVCAASVSYTHLDVYKRQALQRAQTVRTPEQERLERAASRMTAWLIILAAGVGTVWV